MPPPDKHSPAAFTLVGGLLTFLGFVHGEAIGIGRWLPVAVPYLPAGAFLFGLPKYAEVHPQSIDLPQAQEAD